MGPIYVPEWSPLQQAGFCPCLKMAVANNLSYFDTPTIISVKSFILHTPVPNVIKLFVHKFQIFIQSQSVYQTRLEKLASGKHSSLLQILENYRQTSFITLGTVFLINYQFLPLCGRISPIYFVQWSPLWQAPSLSCKYQTTVVGNGSGKHSS